MTTRNVYDHADEVCDELERRGIALGVDGRAAVRDLARRVALDAAAVCDQRASKGARPMVARREGAICAASVRHFLLCRSGEVICIQCNGGGCATCRHRGVRESTTEPSTQH